MSHANAALTPRARLRLARLIVDRGWPPARAAERYDVSWKTAAKWAARYRAEGPAGMVDRSSRPHRRPNRTPPPVVRKIVHLRWKHRLGPVEIGDRLGLPSSTVHAVLVRCRINRLSHIDRSLAHSDSRSRCRSTSSSSSATTSTARPASISRSASRSIALSRRSSSRAVGPPASRTRARRTEVRPTSRVPRSARRPHPRPPRPPDRGAGRSEARRCRPARPEERSRPVVIASEPIRRRSRAM